MIKFTLLALFVSFSLSASDINENTWRGVDEIMTLTDRIYSECKTQQECNDFSHSDVVMSETLGG